MKRLSRKLEYSLMALKRMSQKKPGELTTAKEVSESCNSPFDATAKVLQLMAQQGLLRSEQGTLGGYQITQDLSQVSLRDLMGWIEGTPPAVARCLERPRTTHMRRAHGSCEIQRHCNIISPLQTLNNRLNCFYENLSLEELLNPPT